MRGLVCRYVLLCIVGYRWFKCGVIGRQGGLAVLELHELKYQVYFLNSRCHVRCHTGTEKWGTRAHQARVPQKVVYCYIFPKQCFGANISIINANGPFCPEMEYMCKWTNPSNPVHVLIGPCSIAFDGLDILEKWLIDLQKNAENELMWTQ